MSATVTPIEEGGYVVRGTLDETRARAEVYHYLRAVECFDQFEASETALRVPLHRAGLFRWNPCSARSCWAGYQAHSAHIGYADRPGRGVFPGVLLSW